MKVKGQTLYFLVNVSPQPSGRSNFKLCRYIGHMMYRALSNIWCGTKVTGQKLYWLVNASFPQPLDVATSYFVGERSHDLEGTGQHLVDLDPNIKV